MFNFMFLRYYDVGVLSILLNLLDFVGPRYEISFGCHYVELS